ncbi:ArsR/SmtB family transcription factor [Dehalobacterium formicoaceticum]|uniref:ArsR/SmtB family transcription factor n=1 Tax=Dehalobacterium formicoaceticum TaxID=51515 RepID=UPI0030B83F92
MKWLKEPENYFTRQEYQVDERTDWDIGVCVDSIQKKANVSQSTISHYLDIMQRAGLLIAERRGKWTYYRRNEETIQRTADYVAHEL